MGGPGQGMPPIGMGMGMGAMGMQHPQGGPGSGGGPGAGGMGPPGMGGGSLAMGMGGERRGGKVGMAFFLAFCFPSRCARRPFSHISCLTTHAPRPFCCGSFLVAPTRRRRQGMGMIGVSKKRCVVRLFPWTVLVNLSFLSAVLREHTFGLILRRTPC